MYDLLLKDFFTHQQHTQITQKKIYGIKNGEIAVMPQIYRLYVFKMLWLF